MTAHRSKAADTSNLVWVVVLGVPQVREEANATNMVAGVDMVQLGDDQFVDFARLRPWQFEMDIIIIDAR
jgi:hypothetical protein